MTRQEVNNEGERNENGDRVAQWAAKRVFGV